MVTKVLVTFWSKEGVETSRLMIVLINTVRSSIFINSQ